MFAALKDVFSQFFPFYNKQSEQILLLSQSLTFNPNILQCVQKGKNRIAYQIVQFSFQSHTGTLHADLIK